MTAVLPAGWTPLPFAPERGVPQQAQAQVGGRTVTVVLAAVTTDIAALLSAPGARLVVDGSAERAPRAAAAVAGADPDAAADPRTAFTAPPPGVLDTAAVRPYLVVAEAGRLLGSAPVTVGRPMPFGTSGDPGLRVEVLVAELALAAGSLVAPVDAGSRIVAGIRDRTAGRARHELPATPPEGNPYDLLV